MALGKAVVLFSGGLDSTTLLLIAQSEGFDVYPLSFNYAQRHTVELESARRILKTLGITRHLVMPLSLNLWGGSALTDSALDVPEGTPGPGIPITYVPARNLVFLSLATAYAEAIGAKAIFIGVNNVDYSNYPDCRPDFIAAFEKTAELGTRYADIPDERIVVRAPLQNLSKAEIIQRAAELNAPLHLTHSCYNPTADGRACGHCDSCRLRREGFQKAGVPDPTPYAL